MTLRDARRTAVVLLLMLVAGMIGTPALAAPEPSTIVPSGGTAAAGAGQAAVASARTSRIATSERRGMSG